jgi:hypothetical protein
VDALKLSAEDNRGEFEGVVAERDRLTAKVKSLQASANREWEHAQELAGVVEELREQVRLGSAYPIVAFAIPCSVDIVPILLQCDNIRLRYYILFSQYSYCQKKRTACSFKCPRFHANTLYISTQSGSYKCTFLTRKSSGK